MAIITKPVYRCRFNELHLEGDRYRASVVMVDDHQGLGGRKGEYTTTSAIRTIDFDNKVIITQNSIYVYDN